MTRRSVVSDAENLLGSADSTTWKCMSGCLACYLSWARGRLGDARSGADELRQSPTVDAGHGNRLGVPAYLVCKPRLKLQQDKSSARWRS